MLYLAENKVQPEYFSSIPQTMWWSIITLTTVGYGDVSPITPLGQVFGAITAVMGVMSVALLTGIVASGFSSQMSRRKQIVEAEIAEALSDGVISEEEEKVASIIQKSFPGRIKCFRGILVPPNKAFRESKINDFPEPESPVMIFKPFSKLISIISIRAIFSILSCINMINLPYKKINFFFKKIKVLNI